jgi:hypothetical protein
MGANRPDEIDLQNGNLTHSVSAPQQVRTEVVVQDPDGNLMPPLSMPMHHPVFPQKD